MQQTRRSVDNVTDLSVSPFSQVMLLVLGFCYRNRPGIEHISNTSPLMNNYIDNDLFSDCHDYEKKLPIMCACVCVSLFKNCCSCNLFFFIACLNGAGLLSLRLSSQVLYIVHLIYFTAFCR